jgi:methionyl aminopeptidase
MSIESNDDWDGLREVGRIVRLTLDLLEREVRKGVSTGELDRKAAEFLAAEGARSAPALEYGFPKTVLISVNEEIVHGVPGPRTLQDGDLVKLDVTVEKQGYVADAARTVVVGTPSPVAAELMACVRAAFEAGLAQVRAGSRVSAIGKAVDAEVKRRGFKGVQGLTGHGVGRAIHEEPSVPNWYDPWQPDILTDGLVLTIEPMVSAGTARAVQEANGWTIRTADRSLAAHHEHTIVVTSGEPVILTA